MSLLARIGRRPLGSRISSIHTTGSILLPNAHHPRGIQSLALTCYFLHPDLGMTEYEYLCRGTASLLSVDPPGPKRDGPYGHLEVSSEQRKIRAFQNDKGFSPATGEGTVSDMGWLQFMPKEHRPNVHVVASSHVASPFLWLDYYPHDWLTQVRQEHCKYTLEVYESEKPGQVLASFDLHNSPLHHPEGRDIALLHLQDEEKALKELNKLGVQKLYLRNPDKLFSKGETIYFDGFIVHDATEGTEDLSAEDSRIFEPYEEIGTLAFHTNDRFFAETPSPLPEGLCGAPALDKDGELCGVVEGIVPIDHENKKIAGNAAFMPSFLVAAFVEFAERYMLEQMMPKDIFQSVVRAKETNTLGGGSAKVEGSPTEEGGWDQLYEKQVEELKKKYSKEEVDAILWNNKREQKEVMEIMNKEGGDLDEVIARVRAKTIATREAVVEAYKKGELDHVMEKKGTSSDVENDKSKA